MVVTLGLIERGRSQTVIKLKWDSVVVRISHIVGTARLTSWAAYIASLSNEAIIISYGGGFICGRATGDDTRLKKKLGIITFPQSHTKLITYLCKNTPLSE